MFVLRIGGSCNQKLDERWDIREFDFAITIGIGFGLVALVYQDLDERWDICEFDKAVQVDIALKYVVHDFDSKRFDSNTCRGKS